jgi:LysM repeat protein
MKRIALIFSLMLSAYASHAHFAVCDSIGLERKNGQVFVLHRVDPSQTLYAIAKRYGVPLEVVTAANPYIDFNSLQVGMIVRIPHVYHQSPAPAAVGTAGTPAGAGNASTGAGVAGLQGPTPGNAAAGTPGGTPVTGSAVAGKRQIGYMVKSGDSLYGIAKHFGMTLERLRAINSLRSDALQPGQVLQVEIEGPALGSGSAGANNGVANAGASNAVAVAEKPAEAEVPWWVHQPAVEEGAELIHLVHTLVEGDNIDIISRQYGITTEQIQSLNPKIDFSKGMPAVGENIIVGISYIKPQGTSKPSAPPVSNTGGTTGGGQTSSVAGNTGNNTGLPNSIRVTGTGAQIAGNTSIPTNKALALHPTAHEGTFLKVTNPINGAATLVRVVGRLSDADVRAGILVKLSPTACSALGVAGDRFQVLLEYND